MKQLAVLLLPPPLWDAVVHVHQICWCHAVFRTFVLIINEYKNKIKLLYFLGGHKVVSHRTHLFSV